MSKAAFHHEEFFQDSGNMHGNSATNALGRPSLESWDLFTRETLQNSWDARDTSSHDDGVSYSVRYHELTGYRADELRDFFGDGTRGLPSLEEYLDDEADTLPILVVSDSGTAGLQGPTSAAKQYDKQDDFVALIRNIGRNSSKKLKGGTYGFGKGVYFNVSTTRTALVYTRTTDENDQEVSRFIAMANSDGYSDSDGTYDLNYTGRHWWGVRANGVRNSVFADPITGSQADSLARHFLMDQDFTEERPHGTAIAVLGPDFEADEGEKVLETIADALAKWAWPHMVARIENMDPIDFTVAFKNREITIPDPERDPVLRRFVDAYQLAVSKPEPESDKEFQRSFKHVGLNRWKDITSQRPVEYLGRLVTNRFDSDGIGHRSVFGDSGEVLHQHIALIRGPRMIVNYWKGPYPGDDFFYNGVFIASSKLDALFASSEPPAHDEWNPSTVNLKDPRFYKEGSKRPRVSNPVNIALNRIKSSLQKDSKSNKQEEIAQSNSAVSGISASLGDLISTTPGTSNRVSKVKAPKRASSGVRKTKNAKTSASLNRLVSTSAGTVAIFDVSYTKAKSSLASGTSLSVEASVLVDGRRVKNGDDGVEMPTHLGWLNPFSKSHDLESLVANPPADYALEKQMRGDSWSGQYAILQPQDSAISVEINLQDESEEEI